MNVMDLKNIDELAEVFTDITANLEYGRKSSIYGFNEYSDDDKEEWLNRLYNFEDNQSYAEYCYDLVRGFVTITNYSESQSTGWLRRYYCIIKRNFDNKVTLFDTLKEIAMLFTTPHMCPVCHKYEFEFNANWELCQVCHWINDISQEIFPDLKDGLNCLTLNEAIDAYKNGEPIDF